MKTHTTDVLEVLTLTGSIRKGTLLVSNNRSCNLLLFVFTLYLFVLHVEMVYCQNHMRNELYNCCL